MRNYKYFAPNGASGIPSTINEPISTNLSKSSGALLAIRTAEAANITLAAIARSDGFEIFTHPKRITADASAAEAANVDVA